MGEGEREREKRKGVGEREREREGERGERGERDRKISLCFLFFHVLFPVSVLAPFPVVMCGLITTPSFILLFFLPSSLRALVVP